jgi:hypothetical protein
MDAARAFQEQGACHPARQRGFKGLVKAEGRASNPSHRMCSVGRNASVFTRQCCMYRPIAPRAGSGTMMRLQGANPVTDPSLIGHSPGCRLSRIAHPLARRRHVVSQTNRPDHRET